MNTAKKIPFQEAGIDDYGIPNFVEEVLSASRSNEPMRDFYEVMDEMRVKLSEKLQNKVSE